ncbi:hypothetical protein RHGRI_034346 [Rhododendron griersonianum]|uniref:RING-type E3 ubiquitin transferase n=1 Tax=Rhododendron griersonianum TaxID=479676 RepID=A0AAV6I075_9ERIC|nr:hypothetical protein RHGRI_034346 [Rhododendron griersonianum]
MGHSWSSRRRPHTHTRRHHQSHRPPPLPQPPTPRPLPPSYAFAANAPYPAPPQNPNPMMPAPFPYPQNPNFNAHNYPAPMAGQYNYYLNYGNQVFYPLPQPPPPPPPPLYVDHQSAKKVRNYVNVHKDSIRVEADEENPGYHLVSFTFDAIVDGSITIFYFGKEGPNCSFTVLYPKIHTPVKVPFQKGSSQKFCQPSGTGFDLGFVNINDLAKPSPEDVFPLVISAESSSLSLSNDEPLDESAMTTASHAQITQAILEKSDESHFQVKVVKQILWAEGVRYELREIYGISSSTEATSNENDSGTECVICLTQPKDTAVLPCRHMCLCCECAKELRLQSNKCPICRQPIKELMEIKVIEGQS